MNKIKFFVMMAMLSVATSYAQDFKQWAKTPPMGWNSWDCFGPTVVESEVKANADYMAEHLKDYGWEYIVVDIRWYVANDKAGGYNQTDAQYTIDEWGRYIPAVNRFPSAAGGKGFKPLADYVHSKGLKFGIHLMRGLPILAAKQKLPVKGTDGITCDMICNNDSACTWLYDNYKVDGTKEGAQAYYDACFEMYAEWGVDFVKIDDLSNPYHQGEIEMIRKAIDKTGREIVLSLSPGETHISKASHVAQHANMWRTVDDFWDNWDMLKYQFKACAKWAPHIAEGTWPDADMLPLGKICKRGERGDERWTKFTRDEQYMLMNLWCIFKSPLMFGGDLPQNDEFTNSLLTNRDVLHMHHYSTNNRELSNKNDRVIWTADDPETGDKYVAMFYTVSKEYADTRTALFRSGTISYVTPGYSCNVDVQLPKKAKQLALVVTDGGDGYNYDRANWANPQIILKNGETIDLTILTYTKGEAGWGRINRNANIEGEPLKIAGKVYEKGIATHANSVILYDLPEGAVRFTALAGIDDAGIAGGARSSMEFLVFDHDATQDEQDIEDAVITLDLTQLGIPAGQKCRITEMWTGKNMGTYKNSQFKHTLRPHASALFRVTPVK